MWSPREQHAVAVYGEYMYVSGGYASRLYDQFSNCGPYACGDTDASAYRCHFLFIVVVIFYFVVSFGRWKHSNCLSVKVSTDYFMLKWSRC